MRVEEGDRIVDRLHLHCVGRVDAARIALHVNEAVQVVLVGRPLRLLAGLDQESVADAENALQLVAVARTFSVSRINKLSTSRRPVA